MDKKLKSGQMNVIMRSYAMTRSVVGGNKINWVKKAVFACGICKAAWEECVENDKDVQKEIMKCTSCGCKNPVVYAGKTNLIDSFIEETDEFIKIRAYGHIYTVMSRYSDGVQVESSLYEYESFVNNKDIVPFTNTASYLVAMNVSFSIKLDKKKKRIYLTRKGVRKGIRDISYWSLDKYTVGLLNLLPESYLTQLISYVKGQIKPEILKELNLEKEYPYKLGYLKEITPLWSFENLKYAHTLIDVPNSRLASHRVSLMKKANSQKDFYKALIPGCSKGNAKLLLKCFETVSSINNGHYDVSEINLGVFHLFENNDRLNFVLQKRLEANREGVKTLLTDSYELYLNLYDDRGRATLDFLSSHKAKMMLRKFFESQEAMEKSFIHFIKNKKFTGFTSYLYDVLKMLVMVQNYEDSALEQKISDKAALAYRIARLEDIQALKNSKPNSFKVLHDELSKIVNLLDTDYQEVSYEDSDIQSLEGSYGNVTFKLATSNVELKTVGLKMQNCVSSRWSNVYAKDAYIVVGYDKERTPVLCIEISNRNEILECKKKYNRIAELGDDLSDSLIDYVNDKKLGLKTHDLESLRCKIPHINDAVSVLENRYVVGRYDPFADDRAFDVVQNELPF